MINPYIILAFVVVLAGSNWFTYAKAVTHTENRITAEQSVMKDFARDVIADARREIGKDVAKAIADLRPVYRTINQETVREIIEKPVYRDPNCAVPLSGVLQLNAARIGAAGGAGSKPDAGAAKGSDVPNAAAAAGRPDPR